MPQSYQEHNGDNSTHTFTIAFGSGTTKYLKREHIKLYYGRDRVAGTQTNTLTLNTDYVYISDLVIKLIGSALNTGVTVGDPYPLASGRKLTIERDTPQDTLLVPWADGSNLTKEALETSNLQVLFGQQEEADTGLLNSAKAVAAETASNTATSNVATLTANYFKKDGSVAMTGNLQLGTNKITGVGDPTSAQDAVTKAYLERTGSIASAQIVDGTIVDGDVNASAAISGSKLQAASGSNAGSMSSAHYTKLEGVDTGAKDDQTGAEIKAAYEAESNTNAFTDAEKTKLAGCDVGAKDDQTAAEIKSLYESNSNTNAITDAEKTNIGTITNKQPLDSELTTLSGMQAATASKLASSTALTSDIADLNQIDGLTKQAGTNLSDTDSSFPTSKAVVNYVASQIAPLGGLEVVATELAFPNTQPASGVVISISDAGGTAFADGTGGTTAGQSLTGRTADGSQVTINNAPSSLNGETLAAGVGLMVSSTGSSQTYNYHKILGKEDDIKQLSDDINNFNERYRVENTLPAANSSTNHDGDLVWAKDVGKMYVYSGDYNGTPVGSFGEVQSIGNFYIATLSPAFNGSLQDFTITNAPSSAEQILLSINGVLQRPNAGNSTPSEGFALSGSTVKLGAAPANTDTYFAVVIGSTVNIGAPSNNTVTEAILMSNVVSEEKLKVSNSPTNGQFLQAQSGNSGGLTWANATSDLVNDTSPQLGGDLDVNGHSIVSSSNGNIDIDPNGTGDIILQTVTGAKTQLNGIGGDVRFVGSFTNSLVQWDYNEDQLEFWDGVKASFGSSEDLEIWHDSSNTINQIKGNNGKIVISTTANNDDIEITPHGTGDVVLKSNLTFDGTELFVGGTAQGRETQLSIDGSSQDPAGVWTQVGIYSTDTQAANKGGSLGFGGQDGSTAKQQFAAIKGAKENATSGNYAGYLGFWTRPAGDTPKENLRIHSNRNVEVVDGNLEIGTAGHGIDFSATSDATGMTSELLDSYEEGTFTPILNFGGIGVPSYNGATNGTYTRVGNVVHFRAYVFLSDKGSNTGNARLHGLPFTNGSGSRYAVVATWHTSMELGAPHQIQAYVGNNAVYVVLERTNNTSGDSVAVTGSEFNDNSEFMVGGSYIIA